MNNKMIRFYEGWLSSLAILAIIYIGLFIIGSYKF